MQSGCRFIKNEQRALVLYLGGLPRALSSNMRRQLEALRLAAGVSVVVAASPSTIVSSASDSPPPLTMIVSDYMTLYDRLPMKIPDFCSLLRCH